MLPDGVHCEGAALVGGGSEEERCGVRSAVAIRHRTPRIGSAGRLGDDGAHGILALATGDPVRGPSSCAAIDVGVAEIDVSA